MARSAVVLLLALLALLAFASPAIAGAGHVEFDGDLVLLDDTEYATLLTDFDPRSEHSGAMSAAIPADYDDDEADSATSATFDTSVSSMSDAVYDGRHIVADAAYLQSLEANATAGHHSMHLMQSTQVFGMQRLCVSAPWSPRIQPGLLYRRREVSYRQVGSNINFRLAAGFLLLFEGPFTRTIDGQIAVENDIWASNDDGSTWDLIGGHSLFGRSGNVTSNHPQSFSPRRGSNNCADPVTDVVMSVGGYTVSDVWTNQVWHSFDGLSWQNQPQARFAPGRHFTSCDIDESGHAFVIGGTARNVTTGRLYHLNDIWSTNSLWTFNPWRRVTDKAPFSPRAEHLVLVANSTVLKTELIYVIGGREGCTNDDCYDGWNQNDVWVSSDSALSWTLLTANPGFGPRWGHGGHVTAAGVLIMWGGLNSATGSYGDTTTYREIWASFNGGTQWYQCNVPTGINDNLFVRGEQSGAVNARGQLILASGYAYNENGNFQVQYNDVWRTGFSVENTAQLAARCGGASAIPAAGTGLRTWPNAPPTTGTLIFTPLTLRAPWSPRIQPAFLLMNAPRTYTNPSDGSTATTGPNWLLMYEGSLTTGIYNENDVYASADNGHTWTLISGVALQGSYGYRESAYPTSSFIARGGASNCEDPTNDDVYALGGIIYTNFTSTYGNEVFYSSDAIHWVQRPATSSFGPGRYFASCDVDSRSRIYIIGGQGASSAYYNDIWRSSTKGATWQRVTLRAPFPPRSEHAVQIVPSEVYQTDLIYVMGGFTTGGAVLNDVWVSSEGSSWTRLTATAQWDKRWGHGAAITSAGVMLILGGTSSNYNSFYDLWASFNGGIRWYSCKLPAAGAFIRGEQAVALTSDERLIVGNGYRYSLNGGYRSEYSDLWISDISFANPTALARTYCSAPVPSDGIGLLNVNGWDIPANNTGSGGDDGGSSSSGANTSTIILLVIGIVAAIGVVWYIYRNYKKTGSWNPFESAPQPPTSDIIDTTALFADQTSSMPIHTSDSSSIGSHGSSTQLSAF